MPARGSNAYAFMYSAKSRIKTMLLKNNGLKQHPLALPQSGVLLLDLNSG
jgi:hypothetical protein